MRSSSRSHRNGCRHGCSQLAILDGPAEGIIQFHEFPGVGSIGDEKRGDLMAGFTKPPFYGAAYENRVVMKGVVLIFRASTQPRVEYVSGLLQDVVAGIAKDLLNQNQHEIAKLNAQLAVLADGDEFANLNALKERQVTKGLAISRVLVPRVRVLYWLRRAGSDVRCSRRACGAHGRAAARSPARRHHQHRASLRS